MWNIAKNFLKPLCFLFLLFSLLNIALNTNRTYSVMEPGLGEGYATIYVSPSIINLTAPPYHVGDKFTVQVRIHNYSQVFAWQARLVWDVSLINITSATDVDYVPNATDYIFPAGSYSPLAPSLEVHNSTHRYVMQACATNGAVEYNGTDAGLMQMNFTILSVPPKGTTLSCMLWFEPVDTYTLDENVDENDEERIDGYYEIYSVTAIYLNPEKIMLTSPPTKIGDTFEVVVRIANYSQVAKWQIKLWFDSTLINCTSVSPASDFIFPVNNSVKISNWKNDQGYLTMEASAIGTIEYDGTDSGLAQINFTIIKAPQENQNLTCVLQFDEEDTWIENKDAAKLRLAALDGKYTISRSPSGLTLLSPEVVILIILIIIVAVIIGLFFLKKKKS